MPDKQLTTLTYAAGASLAAITLVYVFAPTFFIDGDSASRTASSRKRTIVGLSNPANDCFINSVLQALAGLGDLRLYLIRETHRRRLDGPDVYTNLVPDPARSNMPDWEIEGLQEGMVTMGLKNMLNALNERPIYKKTITASSFVQCLEAAFKQRISRQQQDAQEFLQIVAERLCDEYHAAHRARNHAKTQSLDLERSEEVEREFGEEGIEGLAVGDGTSQSTRTFEGTTAPLPNGVEGATASIRDFTGTTIRVNPEPEDGFPLEGGSESQIECKTCGFKPRPNKTTFCSLTLSVPQDASTSLSSCFDQLFKKEEIEDYKCEKCRLVHAVETYEHEMARSNSEKFKTKTLTAINRLRTAIETDPEEELKDVELPDMKFAPKRTITKHNRITKFPKIIAIHLSRSIFDAGRSTLKNSAKVSFPEQLPLGGLANRRTYRLSSVVCHKGSHHSGHYETFRRQTIIAPFSTPNTFQPASVYSKPPTPMASHTSTPKIGAATETSTLNSTPEDLSPSSASSLSSPSLAYDSRASGDFTQAPSSSTSSSILTPTVPTRETETGSIRSIARSAKSTLSKVPSISRNKKPSPETNSRTSTTLAESGSARKKKEKTVSNRWWRISDDKVKESKTSDVLAMQREVYLLFYELEKDDL